MTCLRELVKSNFDKAKDKHVTSYVLKYETGVVKEVYKEICHAPLKRLNEKPSELLNILDKGYVCYNSSLANALISRDMKLKYLNWLQNDSPYQDAFLTKDAEEALDEGHFVDVTQPYGLIMHAMIASRKLWEFSTVLVAWDELTKRGVHPDLAFIFAHYVWERAGKIVLEKRPGVHKMWGNYGGVGAVRNFLAHRIVRNKGSLTNTRARYTLTSTYGVETGNALMDGLCKKLGDKSERTDCWGDKIITRSFSSYEELAKQAAPHLIEYYKHLTEDHHA